MGSEFELRPMTPEIFGEFERSTAVLLERMGEAFQYGPFSIFDRLIPDFDQMVDKPNCNFVMLMPEIVMIGQLVQRLSLPPFNIWGWPLPDSVTLDVQDHLVSLVLTGWNGTFADLSRDPATADAMNRLATFSSRLHPLFDAQTVADLVDWAAGQPAEFVTPLNKEIMDRQRAILIELQKRSDHLTSSRGDKTPFAQIQQPAADESTWAAPRAEDAVTGDTTTTFSSGPAASAMNGPQGQLTNSELPTWSPQWIKDLDVGKVEGPRGALLFGVAQPWQELLRSVNRLSSLGAMLVVALGLLVWAYASPKWSSATFFMVTLGLLGGFVSGLTWWRHNAAGAQQERVVETFLVLIAAVPSWIILVSIVGSRLVASLLMIAVFARVVFRAWLSQKDRDHNVWVETMQSSSVDRVRPWSVVWAAVKNDNDDETTWGKVRPCIVLPPSETWRNHKPPSVVECYSPNNPHVVSDGYPVLICTSQEKRANDPRYLEIHPYLHSTDRNDKFTRSFVNLSDLYLVDSNSGTESRFNSKLLEYELMVTGHFDNFIVVESLGPLLNDVDSERICDALQSFRHY